MFLDRISAVASQAGDQHKRYIASTPPLCRNPLTFSYLLCTVVFDLYLGACKYRQLCDVLADLLHPFSVVLSVCKTLEQLPGLENVTRV